MPECSHSVTYYPCSSLPRIDYPCFDALYFRGVKNLIDKYLKTTKGFSTMLWERTPTEVAYDNAVVVDLRKGLSIKKALRLAKEKYPDEALQWNEETIQDIKAHYEYLRNHEDIVAKHKRLSSTEQGTLEPLSATHIINRKMKYYSVDILCDFDTLREMPPGSGRHWKAAGYFQFFYCTKTSKEKAKQIVLDFDKKKEMNPGSCKFKCDRLAWMRSSKKREQIVRSFTANLIDELFEKRNKHRDMVLRKERIFCK